jgi:hypothetical protein
VDEPAGADERRVAASTTRQEWDRALTTVTRVLDCATRVRWVASAVVAVVLVAAGWWATSGVLRWSAVLYGTGLGLGAGHLVRSAYVARGVRRAVRPLGRLLVPDVVAEAGSAQLVSLLVNRGAMFEPYVQLRAVVGEEQVDVTLEDLADREWPRPGFWQLLFTGPDGTYYDDGSGTMDDAAGDDGGGLDPGDALGDGGGGFDLGDTT